MSYSDDRQGIESHYVYGDIPNTSLATSITTPSTSVPYFYCNHSLNLQLHQCPSCSPLDLLTELSVNFIAHDGFANPHVWDVLLIRLGQHTNSHRPSASMWLWHILEDPAPTRQ